MDSIRIETNRLILRRFEETDMDESEDFFEKRLKGKKYCFAICLKDDDYPIGYVHVEDDDSHDFGYALRKEYWHKGIVSEASTAVIESMLTT